MQALLAYLTALHPLAPWGLLTLAIWLSAYVIRKLVPKLWELPAALALREAAFLRFPDLRPALSFLWSVWQGLPSVLLGALVGAWQLGTDPAAAWKGAIAGALAPALHHLLKALPFIPYRGELGSTSRLPPPSGGFVLVLFVFGCSSTALPDIKSPPADPAARAEYFAEGVRHAVALKESTKREALAKEGEVDTLLRTGCAFFVTYRNFAPDLQALADVDAACAGYLSTPAPAKLEPPAASPPPPSAAPPPEPSPPVPVETDAGAPVAPT